MFNFKPLATALLFSSITTYAIDMEAFHNNKEIRSIHFSNKQMEKTVLKLENIDNNIHYHAKEWIRTSLESVENNERVCSLEMSKNAVTLKSDSPQLSKYSLAQLVTYLRAKNSIDDLLAQNILNSSLINKGFNEKTNIKSLIINKKIKSFVKENNILSLYESLSKDWPDGKSNCLDEKWISLKSIIYGLNRKKIERLGLLKKINLYAYKQGIITQDIYGKLESLRNNDELLNYVPLHRYFDITLFAKDKLKVQNEEEKSTNEITSDEKVNRRTKKLTEKQISRKEKLTRRNYLYKNYSSAQIMLLADVLSKTSKRMFAYKTEIFITYEPSSDPEVILVSPADQFRMALKLLNRDIQELQNSQLFAGKYIDFDDVIYASYETGYFMYDELSYIIEYEDFWNPRTNYFLTSLQFILGLTGTASFYLPPPFNIIGAIAVVVAGGQIAKKQQSKDEPTSANALF